MAAAGCSPDTLDRQLSSSPHHSRVSTILLTASTLLSLVHTGLFPRCRCEPCTDENPPTFPLHIPPGGGRALAMRFSKKGEHLPRTRMNFLILASDPKSTGILCQGGEEEDGRNWAQARERCGPRNSRAYDRLRLPAPTGSCSGFPYTWTMKGPGLCLGGRGNGSLSRDTPAPPSAELCPCPNLLQKRVMTLRCPVKLLHSSTQPKL